MGFVVGLAAGFLVGIAVGFAALCPEQCSGGIRFQAEHKEQVG